MEENRAKNLAALTVPLPEDIEKYKDTYKVGWEAIRNAR